MDDDTQNVHPLGSPGHDLPGSSPSENGEVSEYVNERRDEGRLVDAFGLVETTRSLE